MWAVNDKYHLYNSTTGWDSDDGINWTYKFMYVLDAVNGRWFGSLISENNEVDASIVLASRDGLNWSTAKGLGDFSKRGFFYIANKWFAYLADADGLYSSSNGFDFELVNDYFEFLDVTTSDTMAVAAIKRTDWFTVIGSSTDGVNWRDANITLDSTASIDSIYYGGGIWHAWGKASGAGLYYSEDGITWTLTNLPVNISDVYYANSIWTASIGSNLYQSADGINWELCAQFIAPIRCIEHASVWVISITDNGLYYSTDILTWTPTNLSGIINDNFTDIKFADNIWVAVNERESESTDENNCGIYYSLDGITWIREAKECTSELVKIFYVPTPLPDLSYWSWTATNGDATDAETQAAYQAITTKQPTTNFSHKVWNDLVNKIKSVYEREKVNIFTDFDANLMTENDKVLTASRYLNTFAPMVKGVALYPDTQNYPNIQYPFTNEQKNLINTTSIDFYKQFGDSNMILSKCSIENFENYNQEYLYFEGNVLTMGEGYGAYWYVESDKIMYINGIDDVNDEYHAWYSTDGSTFHELSLPSTMTERLDIMEVGDKFFIQYGFGNILVSSDGITWETTNRSQILSHYIKYINGIYYTSDYYGLYASSDGLNWTKVHTDSSSKPIFINGYWMDRGSGAYSVDGWTWKNGNAGTMSYLDTFGDMALYYNGAHNLVNYKIVNDTTFEANVFPLRDGTDSETINVTQARGRIGPNNIFYCFGATSGCMWITMDGTTFTKTNNTSETIFYAGSLYYSTTGYSTDCITWTDFADITDINGAYYADGTYMLSVDTGSTSSSGLYSSADGITFTKVLNGRCDTPVYKIKDKYYVHIKKYSAGYNINYSTDLTTWTECPGAVYGYPTGVQLKEYPGVLIYQDDEVSKYSVDGINFATIEDAEHNPLSDYFTRFNGKYIGIGYNKIGNIEFKTSSSYANKMVYGFLFTGATTVLNEWIDQVNNK